MTVPDPVAPTEPTPKDPLWHFDQRLSSLEGKVGEIHVSMIAVRDALLGSLTNPQGLIHRVTTLEDRVQTIERSRELTAQHLRDAEKSTRGTYITIAVTLLGVIVAAGLAIGADIFKRGLDAGHPIQTPTSSVSGHVEVP